MRDAPEHDDDEREEGAVEPSGAGMRPADVARLRDLVRRGRDQLDRASRADTALAEGISALYDKDYAVAAAALSTSIAATPERGDAHYYLGLTRFMQGRHEDAAVSYAQAIQNGHAAPEAMECLGDVLTVLGRDEDAIETYRAALSKRPSPHGWARLAEALARVGQRSEAVAAYKEALQLRLAGVAPLYDIPADEVEPDPNAE